MLIDVDDYYSKEGIKKEYPFVKVVQTHKMDGCIITCTLDTGDKGIEIQSEKVVDLITFKTVEETVKKRYMAKNEFGEGERIVRIEIDDGYTKTTEIYKASYNIKGEMVSESKYVNVTSNGFEGSFFGTNQYYMEGALEILSNSSSSHHIIIRYKNDVYLREYLAYDHNTAKRLEIILLKDIEYDKNGFIVSEQHYGDDPLTPDSTYVYKTLNDETILQHGTHILKHNPQSILYTQSVYRKLNNSDDHYIIKHYRNGELCYTCEYYDAEGNLL